MKFLNKIFKHPKWILFALFISVTAVNFNHERWLKNDVINHDINSYYSYLPALFNEKDIALSFMNDTINKTEDDRYYWPNYTPEGSRVIKTTMGMAITYLPFIIPAHLYATMFNYDTNGFSPPYHFAVLFSSLFYFIIGLLFLIKILRLYFNDTVTTLSLFCICFATNAFCYLTLGGGNSHPVCFMCIAAIVYYTILWHRVPTKKAALNLGFFLGLLVLVRPVDILIIVFFLFYDVTSALSMRNKFKFYLQNLGSLTLIALSAFILFIPQLIYWKYVTGNFLFNSYTGERFYFDNPHIIAGMVGFRKGWLIYTPVMIFSLVGMFYLRAELKKFRLAIIVFFLIFIYICFSWWCWWYGGSFGQRVMIDIYPLLAISLAAFFSGFYVNRTRILINLLITFFTFLNLFQLMQFRYNIIHYDSMTARNYFRVFFTTTKKPDREKYLYHPDYAKALRGEDD